MTWWGWTLLAVLVMWNVGAAVWIGHLWNLLKASQEYVEDAWVDALIRQKHCADFLSGELAEHTQALADDDMNRLDRLRKAVARYVGECKEREIQGREPDQTLEDFMRDQVHSRGLSTNAERRAATAAGLRAARLMDEEGVYDQAGAVERREVDQREQGLVPDAPAEVFRLVRDGASPDDTAGVNIPSGAVRVDPMDAQYECKRCQGVYRARMIVRTEDGKLRCPHCSAVLMGEVEPEADWTDDAP